jgi:hypothetical protein
MDRNRKDNRMPFGLNLLVWPALVRAPWLIGSLTESDRERRHDAERRRRFHR